MGVASFTVLQILLLSTRPWAFFLPASHHQRPLPPHLHQHQHLQQHQRRGFGSSSTSRPAFYTNDSDGLLPRLPPKAQDWVRACMRAVLLYTKSID